jgi:plastocyanin
MSRSGTGARLPGAPHRAPWVALLALLLGVLLAACGGGSTSSDGGSTADGGTASGTEVTIKDLAFTPATLTVAVGSTVTWTNEDAATHTVTADDGSFDSGSLAQGDTFTQTFDTAGTYAYHCTMHPSMVAEIVVH